MSLSKSFSKWAITAALLSLGTVATAGGGANDIRVPASVLNYKGPLVTASSGSGPVSGAPVQLMVQPGVNELVRVAKGHLNRIITPFKNPRVETSSSASIKVKKNAIYIEPGLNDDPVTMFIMPGDDNESTAISLSLIPTAIPPVELNLSVQGFQPNLQDGDFKAAEKFETAQPFVKTVVSILTSIAKQEIPEGYSLSKIKSFDERPLCTQNGLSFDFSSGQMLRGHHYSVVIGVATNQTQYPVELSATPCVNERVVANAPWPDALLVPGSSTELYVVLKNKVKVERKNHRPSLIRQTGNY